MENNKQLALIRNPRVQIEDHSMRECLFFDAYISEGQASLQIVSLPLLIFPELNLMSRPWRESLAG